MLDESLLDDGAALEERDRSGLLLGAAAAGARVRIALRLAQEAGAAGLTPDGRPRSLLVAGHGDTCHVGDLIAALAGNVCPVLTLHPTGDTAAARPAPPPEAPAVGGPAVPGTVLDLRWSLPGWAGPLDLLMIGSSTGTEPGLVALVEQAYQHGSTVVCVAPPGTPLADAVAQTRGMALPFALSTVGLPEPPAAPETTAFHDPGRFWAILVPLLVLLERLGITRTTTEELGALADRLDAAAERCGPAAAVHLNPAKALAVQLADSLPLLWSEGAVPSAVARRFAALLAERAGRPALAAELPEALLTHRGLLSGAFAGEAHTDDFFRDRVEDPAPLELRIVLLRANDGEESAPGPAHRLADEHETPLSEPAASAAGPLETAADLLALADFLSVYLAVADAGRS
ncbi:SIS domain-containing protein [Streptomyces sp. NPDC059506]|uniref:SIS domain-containing protein n=1 Tax=Streptomyces TaxID=1883 RepID=UPI0015FB6282|nr:SIS domain-containing protein [Streptomyces sp. SCUT-3]QMV23195.1 mannose-6-phosphate isomerase [Streptomyces sp. SCUT-3]